MGDFLFARPSFVTGVARILDIGGTLQEYNTSRTPEEADTRALRADFVAVGADLLEAMNNVSEEEETPKSASRR